MMTVASATHVKGKRSPPLQHGDHLSLHEFERRWEMQPDLKKAELLNGMVFLAAQQTWDVVDPKLPPLANGDHLSREEFERRWDNMPGLKKAELLNGMVFMAPPVSAEHHGIPHSDLLLWLGLYRSATSGVVVADNSTYRLHPDSDAQPDAMLFILPGHGGSAHFDENGYVYGIPELVVEVAASSVNYDLHLKRDIYLRNQIPEYLVWSVYEEEIVWMVLEAGSYRELQPGQDGVLRSGRFPGLWLDPAALLSGNLAAVIRVAQLGTATPEHAAFCGRLRDAAARR